MLSVRKMSSAVLRSAVFLLVGCVHKTAGSDPINPLPGQRSNTWDRDGVNLNMTAPTDLELRPQLTLTRCGLTCAMTAGCETFCYRTRMCLAPCDVTAMSGYQGATGAGGWTRYRKRRGSRELTFSQGTEEPTTGLTLSSQAAEEPTTGLTLSSQAAEKPTTGLNLFNPATEEPTKGLTLFNPATEEPTTGLTLFNPATEEPTTGLTLFNPATEEPTTGLTLSSPAAEERTAGLTLSSPAAEEPTTGLTLWCPSGHVHIVSANLCYLILTEEENHMMSRHRCQVTGGRLAVLDSTVKLESMVTSLRDEFADSGSFHIGAKRSSSSGPYRWEAGGEAMETSWAGADYWSPFAEKQLPGYDCIVLRKRSGDSGFKVIDNTQCGYATYFICEHTTV